MSLLMDALKKAEQAKRQGQAQGDTAGSATAKSELSLELVDEAPPGSASTAEQAPGAATIGRTTAREAPGRAQAEVDRAAAQNLFQAKQAEGSSKAFAIGIGVATLIAVIGIGAYFWLQLRPAGSGVLVARPAPGAATRTAPTTMPMAATPARPALPPAPPANPPKAADTPLEAPSRPQPAPPDDAPIHITKTRLGVDPALERGYEAYNAGNLAKAQAEYGRLLASEPKNGEALVAMAQIAVREGRPEDAKRYYQRALEADPQNALAQAGLVSLEPQADPVTAESRLKSRIAAQPELPALHFALGNVYARQGRWSEAQQAYFKAYSLDAANPDYLFNLAVSLDQLHQAKLAAEYYNRALVAAAQRPAGFDQAQVQARLHDLQH